MSARGAPSNVALAFCAPAMVMRDPPPFTDSTATDPFALNVAATPPGSWSSCLNVDASTRVVTLSETSSARWPSWSSTIRCAATGTVRVDSVFFVEPSSTTRAGGVCGCADVTAAKMFPLAGSTWIAVTVPLTANTVELRTVFVAPSISMSDCVLESSSTRIRFADSFSARATGRPPTLIVAMSSCVVALNAPTVPSSGWAT